MHNKSAALPTSSEKRDPGFVKMRRGLREHLSSMSSNAVKLYIWLQLTANWCGPKRGWVEASFEDTAFALGWSLKILRSAVEELEAKSYVEVERASNQHELTQIKILKYDREKPESAVLTSEHHNNFAPHLQGSSREVAPSLAPSLQGSSEGRSKPANQQSRQDLHAPKKAKKYRKEEEDTTAASSQEEKKEAAWEAIGAEPSGSVKLCQAWEHFYDERREGEKLSDVMERCIQRCQASGIRVSPPFFAAKRRVEEKESNAERNAESDEVARVAGPRGVREELMR